MIVTLKSPTGVIKRAKIGFSWTTFFFGFFVPLFRGDAKWTIVILLADFCTFWLANLVFCFLYNKFYLSELLEKGYAAADQASETALRQKGFIA